MTRISNDTTGFIVTATGSKQFCRRWSGPVNPKKQPGQKPVAKVPIIIDHDSGATVDDPWLVGLAADIRSAIMDFNSHTSAAVEAVIHVGEKLAEAKSVVGHGRFLAWVAVNCDLSERSVQDYLRLYEHRDEVRVKYAAGAADFSMRAALKALATPMTGPRARRTLPRAREKRFGAYQGEPRQAGERAGSVRHSASRGLKFRSESQLIGWEAVPQGEVLGARLFVEIYPGIVGAPARVVVHGLPRLEALQFLRLGVQLRSVGADTVDEGLCLFAAEAVLRSQVVDLVVLAACHAAPVGLTPVALVVCHVDLRCSGSAPKQRPHGPSSAFHRLNQPGSGLPRAAAQCRAVLAPRQQMVFPTGKQPGAALLVRCPSTRKDGRD
jgi:hypothetical protein